MMLRELFNGTVSVTEACKPSTLIEDCSYVVVDTELTGLDLKKDSIVSLGAVGMTGGRIHLDRTFYRMVSPATALTSESVCVHGITPCDVADKPALGSVVEDFLTFCEGAVVVGHFIALDLAFLNKELKRLPGMTFERPVVDTVRVHQWIMDNSNGFSRHYNGTAPNIDLFSMAHRYNIPVSEAHNAEMDAFITAQLFQRFLRSLPELGVRTVQDLLRIGKP